MLKNIGKVVHRYSDNGESFVNISILDNCMDINGGKNFIVLDNNDDSFWILSIEMWDEIDKIVREGFKEIDKDGRMDR